MGNRAVCNTAAVAGCALLYAHARACAGTRAHTQRTLLCRPTAPMGSFASAHLITLRSPRGAPHRPRRSPSLFAACWRVACMGRAVARATCRYTEAAQCRPHAMVPTSAQLRPRARGRVKGAASFVPQNHEMRQHHTWQHERRLSTLNRGHAVHATNMARGHCSYGHLYADEQYENLFRLVSCTPSTTVPARSTVQYPAVPCSTPQYRAECAVP